MVSLDGFDVVGVGLAVATALFGVAFWDALPTEMAIHFGVGGRPDNVAPRWVGVSFVPALMLGTLAFLNGAARLDPPDSDRVFDATKLWTMAVLAYVQAFVVAWNLGHELSVTVALVPVLGSAAVLVVWALLTERRVAAG